VNDVVVSHIHEPHQTIVVLAGEDYVALELYFADSAPCNGSAQPDEVVLLGTAAAERLVHVLTSAATKAREAS
jgi:hypothetical protein